MNLTPLIRPLFVSRTRHWDKVAPQVERLQRQQLRTMLAEAARTWQGRRYGYDGIASYEQYARTVPVTSYADIRQEIERMITGEADVLWPGVTRRFAQSSGTSDGKSKYIPITDASLRRNHYQGGFDAVAHYLKQYPDSRLFAGKGFILGGSYATEHPYTGARIGDLSATLIDRINPLANLVRIPPKPIALMADWTEKLPALVEASMNEDVTNLSGVPSWFLTILKEVLKRKGATSIHDVWPNLEVFFHGGISMAPYRRQYAHITDTARMRYLETYNASEGFFAVQTRMSDPSMALITDAGIFYEFIPIDQVGEPWPEAVPAWKAEPGKTYAMVITACNGLWRYDIGDTVTIASQEPIKITIAGRTKHYINAFGEELMVHNAEAAMAATCRELGCEVANYTAAPVYAGDSTRGRHQWLVEFVGNEPDLQIFATTLDTHLQDVNSDYQAKRSGSIFLDPPEVIVARPGLFTRWLASTGKLGGQRKVPRLCPDRRIIDPMLDMNA